MAGTWSGCVTTACSSHSGKGCSLYLTAQEEARLYPAKTKNTFFFNEISFLKLYIYKQFYLSMHVVQHSFLGL